MMRLACILLAVTLALPAVWGHSVHYDEVSAKGVRFSHAPGSPMKQAKVKIFAPGVTDKPALTLTTDDDGVVLFSPTAPGTWVLMARDNAGHVKRVNVDVGADHSHHGDTLSWMQKLIMALAVAWGAIGTALYFSRRRRRDDLTGEA